MTSDDAQPARGRRGRGVRGGLWRAIRLLEEAAAESPETDWIDAALADAMAARGLAATAVIEAPDPRPCRDDGRGSWSHLWRCRPEGLPAARAAQCCTGAVGEDGRCSCGPRG
ncbi:MAG: hypothetical protein ACKOWF_07905 [Chloroflexota bacterium]